MSKLVIMVGVSGSGKTTVAKSMLTNNDLYISRDAIRLSLIKDGDEYFSKENEVRKILFKTVNEALASNLYKCVYVDATNLNGARRQAFLNNINCNGIEVCAIYVDTPLEVCLLRNSKRKGRELVPESTIKEMYRAMTVPDLTKEKIDVILFVDEDGKVIDKNTFENRHKESRIFLSSDLHLGHNKEFCYEARGYSTVEEMNEDIVKKWNSVVNDWDTVYLLGDNVLGDIDEGMKHFRKLKGNIYCIRGNHDTDRKVEAYLDAGVKNVLWSDLIRYKKRMIYLSHFPCITTIDDGREGRQSVYGLFGHTHQETPFYEGNRYLYNVGMDAHNCTPVLLDTVLERIEERIKNNGN